MNINITRCLLKIGILSFIRYRMIRYVEYVLDAFGENVNYMAAWYKSYIYNDNGKNIIDNWTMLCYN